MFTLTAMADQQHINVGPQNGKLGESPYSYLTKTEANFTELWSISSSNTTGLTDLSGVTNIWKARANLQIDTPVNVKWFGAKGDGSDDTAAIQSAINSITNTGGTVLFPAGRYGISAALRLDQNAEITLQGYSTFGNFDTNTGSVFCLRDLANSDMLVKGPNGKVSIKGIFFFGNSDNQTVSDLHGIWLQAVSGQSKPCVLENVTAWGVNGVGFQIDAREVHLSKCRADYNNGDGFQVTATSDTSAINIDAGFNGGNGLALSGAAGIGANALTVFYGNIYRNSLCGILLTNASNNKFVCLKTDANNEDGILITGVSQRNTFSDLSSPVNNFPLDRFGNASSIPSGTYSNVRIDSTNVQATVFLGGTFYEYESSLASKPKYLLEDGANGYAGVSLQGTRFTQSPSFWSTGAYALAMRTNAIGTWLDDNAFVHRNNDYFDAISISKFRGLDQLEQAVGIQFNAYFSDIWRYRSNGPAFYLKCRYDDTTSALEFAPSGTADAPITWQNAWTFDSNSGILTVPELAPVVVHGLTLPPASPGLNTASNYFSASGASTSWPLTLSTIYDANTVDQYVMLNGSLSGSKASPTANGGGVGGGFIRSFTGISPNFARLDLGTFGAGAGATLATLLSLSNTVVLINDSGTLKPISYGANDSGGTGYKVLKVAN